MPNAYTGRYVVMGVTGAGKSLIGAALAQALGVSFVDGDDLHSETNRQHMAAGIALTDADRAVWLQLIADRLRQASHAGLGLVVACSALKASYRDILRQSASAVQFIYLKGTPDVIAPRMAQRTGHFMPATLLPSQFATLEEPTSNESAWVIDIRGAPEALVAALVQRIDDQARLTNPRPSEHS